MMNRSEVPARSFRTLVALTPALLMGCNDRFDFDVQAPDAGEDVTTTTGGDADASDIGDVDSNVSTNTATTTTGAEPDAGPDADCASDADCLLSSLHCHVGLGRCVECLDDQDCSRSDATDCDTELGRCVACTRDDQCAEGSRCDAVERRCAPSCVAPQDCVDAHACKDGVCVACDRDVECREGDSTGPVCSASGLGCVSCREDTQCANQEICDVLSGRCVACLTTEDCGDGTVCDPVLLQCVD